MSLLHKSLAIVFCAVAPGASWLDGSGWLAWTMYAKSEQYRFSIRAFDASGPARAVSPTHVGALGGRALSIHLSGTERFRTSPVGSGLRRRLPEIAELACRAAGDAERVEVTIEVRTTLDAPVVTTTHRATCPP